MRRKIYILLMIFILSLGAINIVLAVGSVPGSSDDPLITESFLDKKLQELSKSLQDISSSVNQKLQQISTNVSVLDNKVEEMNKKVGQSSGSTFEAVNLPAGKTLIGEAGTEIILRAGKAKVVSETSAGLSDVTSGEDVIKDLSIEKNHLIIIPRADGRGIIAGTGSVVMVRGGYQIR